MPQLDVKQFNVPLPNECQDQCAKHIADATDTLAHTCTQVTQQAIQMGIGQAVKQFNVPLPL